MIINKIIKKINLLALFIIYFAANNSLTAEKILVPIGKSQTIKTPVPVKRIFVVKQGVIDAPVVTDNEVIITGISSEPDTTQLIIWDKFGNKKVIDVETFSENDLIQKKFYTLFPYSTIKLHIFPDVIYLKGTLDDENKKEEASRILKSIVKGHKIENLIEIVQTETLEQKISKAIKAPNVKVSVIYSKSSSTQSDANTNVASASVLNQNQSNDYTIVLEGSVNDQNEYIRVTEVVKGFVNDPTKIRNLITIDNPIQVIFQAYVLEMRRETTRELGIKWGGATELGGELKQGIINFYENPSRDYRGTERIGPAPVPKYPNPFKMNNMNRFEIIDAQITALEKAGKAKVLANPKLICYANARPTKLAESGWLGEGNPEPGKELKAGENPDNDPGIAFFQSGTQREVLVGRDNTGTPLTRQYNAFIRLAIRDLFVQGDSLKYSVYAKRDDFDEATSSINSRSISTTIKCKNGETIVLGGLIIKTKNEYKEAVPGLSRIPFVGRLFEWKRNRREENELVILLTPQIIGRESDPYPYKKFEIIPIPKRSDRLEKLHELFQKIQSSHFSNIGQSK